MNKKIKKLEICIIGLGYVGLPLAVEFGKIRRVIGFDIDHERISDLKIFRDKTLEVKSTDIKKAKFLKFTNDKSEIRKSNCYIVTVPTPIKSNKTPDLKPLADASKMIAGMLKEEDLVIYESTVFPGATEEFCVPILEKYSGLKFNKDFYCGYSPERINPGDKSHTIKDICKITSGSTPKIAKIIDELYSEIITAGTYRAENIKIAEAAKVIENTQRDLNIALMNELALIFNKMKIDTEAVINAASTKWNFSKFYPGLVGGHCIGVDPYYLTYKSKLIGYTPEIILAGRKINDRMDSYVVKQFVREMRRKSIKLLNSKILILGLTFKENCPDIRNSKVINVIEKLNKLGCKTEVYDPYITDLTKIHKHKIKFINSLKKNSYDGIIISVNHKEFKTIGPKFIQSLGKSKNVIYDLKFTFKKKDIGFRF